MRQHRLQPVPRRRRDGELVGYLHIKDVLEPDDSRHEVAVEQQWIRPFATVSADEPLHDALETLQRRGAHMARVVDASSGSTVGVATLEDMVEELVGEIRDAVHLDDHAMPSALSRTGRRPVRLTAPERRRRRPG